jgi:hypothetical protein
MSSAATISRPRSAIEPASGHDVAPAAGYLRGPAFDAVFIGGLALLALACGGTLVGKPALFTVFFLANMWVLGFHHVVATFTRTAFDRPSFAQYRFLVLGLPPIVLVAVAALGFGVGVWTLATIYLYWQTFHYARQSYGIAQVYARQPANAPAVDQDLSRWVLYAVPLWGILNRSHENPGLFLGLDLRCVPVPALAVSVTGALCLGLVGLWSVAQLRLLMQRRLPLTHTLYVLSHIAIFAAGYVLIDDINIGWLVVNMWHNAQYLCFVWYFNNKRFGERVDPQRRFISRLSQRRNAGWYVLTCLLISTVSYGLLLEVSRLVAFQTISLAFIAGQTLNYHHYIVDGIIWRRRAQPAPPPAALPALT